MSIVALSDSSSSNFTEESLAGITARLGFEITDEKDIHDYTRLLWSFEGVLNQIQDGEDYFPPALQPLPTSHKREFWAPEAEKNALNAWSHCCNLEAASPTSDLLKGRTVVIKDNIFVGGLPTTLGAPKSLFKDGEWPVSTIDATVVSRILAADGVIKGTGTCEFYCASPLSFTSAIGPVHNPRLRGYTAGGSSSGCAALVTANSLGPSLEAQDAIELAVGSDQAGSVRIPACFNGIYGLKPTHGLIPYTGAGSMCPMIDHLGPLAANLEDIAVMLEVMAGYDGFDSRMTPESPLPSHVVSYSQRLSEFVQSLSSKSANGKSWRVGVLTESFEMAGVTPVVRDTVLEAAKRIFTAAGATVTEISIPIHKQGPAIWTAATRPSMSSWLCQGKPSGYLSYVAPHARTAWPLSEKGVFETVTRLNPALGNIILSEEFARAASFAGVEAKAHRKVFDLRDAYDKALAEVDVLITPCAPTIAMPHPESVDQGGKPRSILERLGPLVGITSNTCPFNVTGHPAISVPCGSASPPEHADVKLPIGMQIVGRRWADETVIKAAALFRHGENILEK